MKKVIILSYMLMLAFGVSAQVSEGSSVPQFSVKMIDGSVTNIASLKDKVVVLNFWATWCPLCRAELSILDKEIIEKFAGEDFEFIAVNCGESKAEVEKFRSLTGYQFPMALDTDKSISKTFGINSIPRSFIIDREGTIVGDHSGYSNEIFAELISEIEKNLKSK